ncbi:MAG: carboxypeptidase regulatory-like domain-containing protein [Acidobacteria bacterium]|nr:carboxypeptidase regulatory-like domain-containing protein [Acidobacteriota bacterium]
MLSKPVLWRRLFRPISFCLLTFALFSLPSPAQDAPATPQDAPAATEAPASTEAPAGTVQGTVKDVDGNPIEGARVLFRSKLEGTSTVVRSGKNGAYVSEGLAPGDYLVQVNARNLQISETHITVKVGAAAVADFKLEGINPGPVRLESRRPGELVDSMPINGRATVSLARTDPGVQVVDGSILDSGKSGYQALSLNSQYGRTVHYDFDEVEAMDETRGGAIANLPAEAVNELIVTRTLPEVFQSLNAAGSVRLTTRSGGDDWHGNLFGNFRDRKIGLAGFPSGDPKYSRQHYGFGAGGALIKDKAFLYFGGERTKDDGVLPFYQGFPANFLSTRQAPFRENMLTARLDYNWSENAKWFARYSYNNANGLGPTDSLAKLRNQINVPSAVFGLDWNRGRFAHSGRFGYQKLVNSLNPALGGDSLVIPEAPFHLQIGSFEAGPNSQGPRQTIQRDLFGRYDGSTPFHDRHTFRFGGAIHRIEQGDFYSPGIVGPSVTSSNGIDVITAINNDPTLSGGAENPLNYPVGTITIYNGLGNFSEHSAFNRSTGGHTDNRIELYAADTFKLYPNLNIFVGVNYARDTNRTNSDLGVIPCSSINTDIVPNSDKICTGGTPLLDQFGDVKGLGNRVSQPNWNFAPQAGVAWDPGRNGRTVIRAGGGLFYDNFLLQNAYQDRISRLSQGQYFRSLNLCPASTVLFPDGSAVNSVATDGVSIGSLCGQPIGGTVQGADGPVLVADAIQHLQQQYLDAQSSVTGGNNIYSLANSLANFGGTLAPNFRTPRVLHMSAGIQHQLGERSMFSLDYVREIGTQYPLGIDTNHVGDARHLDSAAALAAINATVTQAGCTPAGSAGSESQAAVQCYINAVPGASIVNFARNGLDSGNAFCGPFPCSVLGLPEPAFGGIHATAIDPADPTKLQYLGSNVMYFPSGRTKYVGVHATFRTSGDRLARGIRHWDLAVAYTYSKYQSNVAAADGSGGDFSILSRAEDYIRPHVGHFGSSGLDRRNMFTFAPTFDLPHGPRLSIIAQMASPLELSARLPQLDGGGVAGEIFRTDATGDGTVGDLLPGTSVGGLGGYSGSDLGNAIAIYNKNYAGRLTSASAALVSQNGTIAPLFTSDQLSKLGALYPFVCAGPAQPGCPALPHNPAQTTWLKTVDLRFSWPFRIGERVRVEPNVAAFNIANFANFGGAGRQLNGVLDGSPGSSLNGASSPGTCGNSSALCTSRLDRIMPGSGTYALGAPRQIEFGVKITF